MPVVRRASACSLSRARASSFPICERRGSWEVSSDYETEEAPREFLAAVGARVRSRREALNWSQVQLAREAGLDRTYVGFFKRGLRNISVEKLWRLAVALGVNARDLLPPDDPEAVPRV
jgi:ribosome-binding protein aMBF1 (putative translation factor)